MPSPLRFLRAGPPPPNVVLLPDALFFTRVVAVSEGATAAAAAAEIELALEAVSPFPLAQLYYGWFWKPGARHALLFAAYRRRFTAEQTAAWAEAELVLPTFAALAGAEVPGATTIVLTAPEGLTAVHWETPGVPSQVKFLPLAPEATLGQVTRYLANYNLVGVPVVDDATRLVGAVTVDDVLDHILPEDWRETDDLDAAEIDADRESAPAGGGEHDGT